MCTDVRATVGCAHGYLGLPACMACMRVSGTLCLSCVRAQRAGTYTHARTHTYMRSISREGGGDHIFPAAALRVAQPDGFFRVPAHTYHTRPGSSLAGASTCATCEAGKYSNAGASRVCLLRCPPFPRAPQHVFDVHAYACVCMCRGRQWHPAARMRVCMMHRAQQGSPRARAGQGRVCMHTCAQMCELL